MKIENIIIIFLIISFSFACKSVSKSNNAKNCYNLVAWNEDTLLKHWFTIYNRNHFTYIVSNKDSFNNIIDKEYRGTVRNERDTFFLTYKRNNAPKNATNYLVKEKSSGSLIQYFLTEIKSVSMHVSDLRNGDCWF